MFSFSVSVFNAWVVLEVSACNVMDMWALVIHFDQVVYTETCHFSHNRCLYNTLWINIYFLPI